MTGRPTTFSQEIADLICAHLADGGSLRSFCMEEGNPGYSTVFQWLEKSDTFAEQYARARQMQAHNDADRMNQLVADLESKRITPDVARVMMDGLKWTAGRRLPKVYGDKLALGGDAEAGPITVTWAQDGK